MKKTLTLCQWLIEKTDSETYRAGRLKGEKHPAVDKKLVDSLGGMASLLKQAREIERDSQLCQYIRFDWRDMGNDISKIHYAIEAMPLLCQREGMEDPLEKQLRYIEKAEGFLQEVSGAEAGWLCSYYNNLLEQLRQGKQVRSMEDEDLFRCLWAVARIQKPMWKRVFSAKVFHDSKRFEKKYETKVAGILRTYADLPEKDAMTEEQILKRYGILSYAQMLEWKGAVSYRLDTGKVIDTGDFCYGTIINAQTLEHSRPLEISRIRTIMTIENKANYEAMEYREDRLYIFCHGFFSPKEVNFLQELVKLADEETVFLHWGDMDYGGIRIFQFNKEKIFPKLKPYKMSRESFLEAVKAGAGIELEEEKRKKLEQMKAGELEELKQCILKYGVEIEQEMLL